MTEEVSSLTRVPQPLAAAGEIRASLINWIFFFLIYLFILDGWMQIYNSSVQQIKPERSLGSCLQLATCKTFIMMLNFSMYLYWYSNTGSELLRNHHLPLCSFAKPRRYLALGDVTKRRICWWAGDHTPCRVLAPPREENLNGASVLARGCFGLLLLLDCCTVVSFNIKH